jgi:UDP-N-acetyl-D-glucosamine dehydrogenase
MIKKQILSKLLSRKAVIAIVGLGYVGLPLLLRYVKMGYKVIGIDNDGAKIKSLKIGESYIENIPNLEIQNSLNEGAIFTDDFSIIKDVDAVIICVPTPLTKHREPDISYIISSIDNMKKYIKPGQAISLESTTYPGTTEEVLLPRINGTGFKVGVDVFLIYSPEREDPGNKKYNTATIPKLVSGYSKECLEVGLTLYGVVIDKVIPVSSLKVAEMAKLLENIYRAVNIGLVNEMKMIADKMGIDIYEVINSAATKPFGFTAYYPGPGLGGHCIPIDPFYLTWKAKEYDINAKFIELSGEINASMPSWVVSKTINAMNTHGKSINGSKILIIGVAYKKNVDDIRESPSIEIIKQLQNLGAHIDYVDPHIPIIYRNEHLNSDMKSISLDPIGLASYDSVIIVANHDAFNYELISKNSKLVIDTRGVYSTMKLPNVVSA